MMSSESGQDAVGSDKEVELALSAVHAKVTGVKESLSNFVGKMEHEPLTWPSVLDSFASVSSYTSVLIKQLCSDKMPPLHTRLLLPLEVSSDRDVELEKSTEGRVPILHHEIVPNYLRTKLDLELEAKQNKLAIRAKDEEAIIKGKIKNFNTLLNSTLEKIQEVRQTVIDDQKSKKDGVQNSAAETKKLVAMYLHGSGVPPVAPKRPQHSPIRPVMRSSVPGRVPSAVRTDMKQTVQTSAAPYNRPVPR